MTERDEWNRKVVEEFRANDGEVGGPFVGVPLLLLHHRGAKTGTERINPLAYRRDGDRLVVFGSKGGAPDNPDWYHNVKTNSEVTIEVGTETVGARARVAEGEERDRIWSLQKAEFPAFADYERKTSRQIPVVVLEPIQAESSSSTS